MEQKIKTIEIQAKGFFELIKQHDKSMWSMFNEMITDEEQLIIFLNEDGEEIAHYILPTTVEQLEKDQKTFAEHFKNKLKNF